MLHLARKSEVLLPRDAAGEAEAVQWLFAALNSIEIVTLPWWFLGVTGGESEALTGWVGKRLGQLERVLETREWLAAGRFTVADLLMADVLRVPGVREFGDRPATVAYIDRITARPAFVKAHAEQVAQFVAADAGRARRSIAQPVRAEEGQSAAKARLEALCPTLPFETDSRPAASILLRANGVW